MPLLRAGLVAWLGHDNVLPPQPVPGLPLILRPAGADQLRAVIRHARVHGLGLSVEGARAPFLAAREGWALLRLDRMDSMAFDPARGCLSIGGGRDAAAMLDLMGWLLPGTPSVGAPLALAGSWLLARGLETGLLAGMEVVTDDCRLLSYTGSWPSSGLTAAVRAGALVTRIDMRPADAKNFDIVTIAQRFPLEDAAARRS